MNAPNANPNVGRQFATKAGAPLTMRHYAGRLGSIEARIGDKPVGWLSYGEGPYRGSLGNTGLDLKRANPVPDATHHIMAIDVDPSFRRQGIGSALVQHMAEALGSTRIDPGEMTRDGAGLARGFGVQ